MIARTSSLARDERGQSIVLFVISFTALMGLLALVVNLGFWYQRQRQLQTVADAAAMDAAQRDHDNFEDVTAKDPVAASAIANENWPGSVLTQYIYKGGFRSPTKASLDIDRKSVV